MRRGFTVMEVLVAAAVLATVLMGMAFFQASSVKVNQKERDRALAVQKAVQIMEEILAYQVTSGDVSGGIDSLADGSANYKFMLTIDPKLTDPSSALSGNITTGVGTYRFVRQILVNPLMNEKDARQVVVSVFYSDGGSTPKPLANMSPLATVTNIVKAKKLVSLPTQVYDMFFINIENTIGWWADPATLEKTMLGTVDFLQASNPGLEIRQHWIRQLGYGRDPYYMPTINRAKPLNNTSQVPLNWVYFYPGNIDGNTFKYNPDVMTGQMLQDSTVLNPVAVGTDRSFYNASQAHYAYADQYNNDMRYPEELAKWQAQPAGTEPTLRVFMEKLAAGEYKNAIIVNLHGEGFPMVPMRNYSDAARPPQDTVDTGNYFQNHWGVTLPGSGANASIVEGSRARIVTHPQRLTMSTCGDRSSTTSSALYDSDNTVRLNIHPYLSSNSGTEIGQSVANMGNWRKAHVVVRGIQNNLATWNVGWHYSGCNWYQDINTGKYYWGPVDYKVANGWATDGYGNWYDGPHNNTNQHDDPDWSGDTTDINNVEIDVIDGGEWKMIWPKNTKSSLTGLLYDNTAHGTYMDVDPTFQGNNDNNKDLYTGDLIIQLKNVPYRNGQSLLHGYNYMPDPMLPDMTSGSGTYHNTQRFRVLFRCKSPQLVTAITTVGDDDNLSHHQAPNRSTTYCWVGQTPPITEQFQFTGDPRENPYEEFRDPSSTSYYKHYNRHFDDLTNNAYYNNSPNGWDFPDTDDGWTTSRVDLPRYYEMWRRALFGSNAIYTNVTGWTMYYHVLGGEIQTDVSSKPYDGGSSLIGIDNMFGAQHLVTKSDGTWYAKPWLGELYPDDQWNNWEAHGNIPSGTYLRKPWDDALIPNFKPTGSKPGFRGVVSDNGCETFFNGGASGSGRSDCFDHLSRTGDIGAISNNGTFVSTSLKLTLDDQPACDRPFTLQGGNFAPDWGTAESIGWGTKLEWGLHVNGGGYYWDASKWGVGDDTGLAGAPVVIRRGTKTAYAVINGLAPSVSGGTLPIARNALACSLESIFDLAHPQYLDGSNKGDNAPKLPPLAQVTAPHDGDQIFSSTVNLSWHVDWQRWDTSPYSNQYGSTNPYVNNTYKPAMLYNLKWSPDGGTTWLSVKDNSTQCPAGVYSAAADPAVAVNAAGSWNGTYTWTLLAKKWMPNGAYQVRLEAFRSDSGTPDGYTGLDYCYHQLTVGISR